MTRTKAATLLGFIGTALLIFVVLIAPELFGKGYYFIPVLPVIIAVYVIQKQRAS